MGITSPFANDPQDAMQREGESPRKTGYRDQNGWKDFPPVEALENLDGFYQIYL